MTPSLTQQRVAEVLDYSPETGEFKWRSRKPSSPHQVGDVAGGVNGNGYVAVHVDGRNYLAHRLAWLLVHGRWPRQLIDHRDGNRGNNAIRNLREATKTINGQNQRRAQRNNATGLLGVTRLKRGARRFQAYIRINGTPTYLGVFETAYQASAAYLAAKRQHQEGCTI